jgi:flagellar biosynthesis protein FliQ
LTLSWLPALIVGVFLALLLAAATPPQPPRTPRTRRAAPREEVEETTLIALDVFFWVLVVGMVVSIILAYL